MPQSFIVSFLSRDYFLTSHKLSIKSLYLSCHHKENSELHGIARGIFSEYVHAMDQHNYEDVL